MTSTNGKINPSLDRKKQWLRWFERAGLFFAGFLLVTAVLAFERTENLRESDFVVGEPAPRTLFSPLNMTYQDEEATKGVREKASREVLPVFSIQHSISEEIFKKAEHFFEQLSSLYQETKKSKVLGPEKPLFEISEASLNFLTGEGRSEETLKHVVFLLEQYLARGVVDYAKKIELLESGVNTVTVVDVKNKTEREIPVRDLLALNEVRDRAGKDLPEAIGRNRNLRDAVLEIFHAVLIPNLVFDHAETQNRRKKAAESAAPVEVKIKKGELVVSRGILVSSQQKMKLDQIYKKLAAREVLSKFLAVGFLVFLTYLFCFSYLYFFEQKTLSSFRMVLLIHVIYLLTASLCKGLSLRGGFYLYLMPVPLASLLLALLVHARLGVLSAIVMTLLVAPLTGFKADIILASLLSGVTGTFASLHVRKRIHVLRVGAFIGLTYFFVIFAFLIFQEYPLWESLESSVWGLANGLLVTAACFLLLPLFEAMFNLTTDITLLELSDLNHPLLKRMIVEAPGTYHHSLVVSTLAESACEAIGANAPLARVGCYFHDIGKVEHAEFFTE
ncbi:MAG: HDIG domain-containing protein, partial [Candidatus Omnitrophica bacterium]|nr:HDIG domain-containing protein [Candidatus Omnitrophota bacterium]